MITPLGWLYSCPTYKEQLKEQSAKDLKTYGFLGYPVLQAADILLYNAEYVPVGKDQIPHIELTREIARRFNNFYGNYFVEPQPLLTEAPYVPGIDGRKMSKSYNNCIYLSDSEEEINKKVYQMFTDPNKIRKNDPGNPENCVVLAFHKVFNQEKAKEIESLCREGKLGCVEDKINLAKLLNEILTPIREKRKSFTKEKIDEILIEGQQKASSVAKKTLADVKKLVGI
jgi:tryptophanyl-tRNA synthetase